MANSDKWFKAAYAKQQAGDLAGAEPLYQRILTHDPTHALARYLLGSLYAQSGRHAEAVCHLEQAAALQPDLAEAHHNLSVALRALEQWQKALRCSERALALRPDYAEALHGRGAARRALGQLEEARADFAHVVSLQPTHLAALNALGMTLTDLRRPAEAEAAFRQAIASDPSHAEPFNNLAIALHEQQKWDEAAAEAQQAVALKPDFAEAWNTLGLALRDAGRLSEAEDALRRAIAVRPDYAESLNTLGLALQGQKRLDEAESVFQQIIALRPDYAEPLNNLGVNCFQQRRPAEALQAYERALALKPDFAQALNNKGAALKELGRFDEARAAFARALELNPDYAEAYNNLGTCLVAEDNLEAAFAAYAQALTRAPEHKSARWNRALALLLTGDFAQGWPEYEWRFAGGHVETHRSAQPRWNGETFAGRTLLVHAEQGFGDTLHFVRCLPLVKARGGRVVLECQAALLPLLENCPGADCAVTIDSENDLPAHDLQVPMLSLPALCGTTDLGLVPASVPYLAVPADRAELWSARLTETFPPARGPLKVGIVWAGSPGHHNDANRSVPLAQWAGLADVPGVTFYSVQKGAASDALASAPFPVIDLGPHLRDFADTAAVLSQLDLLIAVDTSVVHLAGALGKPVWTLLPFAPDWRWLRGRTDSPWYPTMRLFRQPAPGAWEPVFAQAADALAQLASDTLAARPVEANAAAQLVQEGEAAFAQGDTADAARCFQSVLDAIPHHARALSNLAVIAFAAGETDEAERLLQRVLATDPAHPSALKNMAQCREAIGDWNGAAAWYQKALARTPHNVSLWNALALCSLQIGQPNAAREALSHSLTLAPEQPDAAALLAELGTNLAVTVLLHVPADADPDTLAAVHSAWAAQTMPASQWEIVPFTPGDAIDWNNTQGHIVVFADCAHLPAPDYLERHLAAHATHSEPHDAILGRRAAPDARNVLFHVQERSHTLQPAAHAVQEGQLLDWTHGDLPLLSIKRELLHAVGPIDAELDADAGALDLLWRLAAQGMTLFACPAATLHALRAPDFADFCEGAAAQGAAVAHVARRHRASAFLHALRAANAEHQLPANQTAWEKASAMTADFCALEAHGWPAVYALPNAETDALPALTQLCETAFLYHFRAAYLQERRRLENADAQAALAAPQSALVSIVMPCFNYARFLPEAVASVLAQTYANWELIVVNDGSTDDTAAVAEALITAHPERRIRLINQENRGLAATYNAGVRAAQGAYILPLDADDAIQPTLLAEAVALLDAHPHLSIIYPDQEHFGENGTLKIVHALDYDFAQELSSNLMTVCSLYRRTAWEAAGGYRETCKGYIDYDFWIACGEKGHVGWRLPRPLFRYRIHGAQLSIADGQKADYLKAHIVLHHPASYSESATRWARGVVAAYEWQHRAVEKDAKTPDALVSVVMPTFNRPQSLKAALESVLAQTYAHWEVVIVNDAGDDVQGVLDSLGAGDKIRLINQPQNGGQARARNAGIAAARGKYIAFLDDDDCFYPEHLETLAAFLENTPFRAAYTDSLRAHQRKTANGGYEVTHRDQPYAQDFDYERILLGNFVPIQCFLTEKACLDALGGFDLSLTSHEDWDLWLRLSRQTDCVHLKATTSEFSWRTDGSSWTGSHARDFARTAALIYEKHRAEAEKYPAVLAAHKTFLAQWAQSEKEEAFTVYAPPASTKGKKQRHLPPAQVDICIVVHNQLEYVRNCVQSVFQHTGTPFHLWLWDNGSDAPTQRYLEEVAARANVTLLRADANGGFLVPNNRLAAHGRASFLILLNSDTEVRAGWEAALIDYLKAHPDTGEVGYGGGLLGPDAIGCGSSTGDAIDYVAGWCACLPRAVVEQHGLFDEGHLRFAYGEDSDLSLRLQEAGLKIYVLPDALVTHFGNATIREVQKTRDTSPTFAANHAHLCRRWADYLANGRVAVRNAMTQDTLNAQINEAERLFAAGDAPAARALLLTLAETGLPRVHNNLGVLAWQDGAREDALRHFARAYESDPRDRTTVLNLADALASLGQEDDARALRDTLPPAQDAPAVPEQDALDNAKRLLVYQGPWNWDFLWNRAQPLATALSKYATVVYLDAETGVPSLEEEAQSAPIRPFGLLSEIGPGLHRYQWLAPKTHAHLHCHNLSRDRAPAQYADLERQLAPLLASHDEAWLVTSNPRASGLLCLHAWDKIIVDMHDPWLESWEKCVHPHITKALLTHADIVFANGHKVASEYQEWSERPIHSLPCAIESRTLEALQSPLPRPAFMKHPAERRCAVFLGSIDSRINPASLREAVAGAPDLEFYFVGPDHFGKPQEREAWEALLKLPHFHAPGKIAHADVPAVLQHADVLLLPYSQLGGQKMFPAKLYEYLASGSLVLTLTDYSDSLPPNQSLIACSDMTDMAARLREVACGALCLPPAEKAHSFAIAEDSTWERRAAQFMQTARQPIARPHVKRQPGEREQLLEQAMRLAAAGKPADAEALLSALIAEAPFFSPARAQLGLLQGANGDIAAALLSLEQALSANPNELDALHGCARILSDLGMADAAQSLQELLQQIYDANALSHEADARAFSVAGRAPQGRLHATGRSRRKWVAAAQKVANCLPEHEPGFLFDLALNAPAGDVLEIGDGSGQSACLFAGACREREDDSRVVCVPSSAAQEGFHHDLPARARAHDFDDALVVCVSGPEVVLSRLNSPLRLAFVDGLTEFAAMRDALRLASERVVPGGFVALRGAVPWPMDVEEAARAVFDGHPEFTRFGQVGACLAYQKVEN